MMRPRSLLAALAAVTLSLAGPLGVADARGRKAPPPVEEDRLSLVALLVRDDQWDRAARALSDIDPDDPAIDRRRHRTLLGLVAFQAERWEGAALALSEARDLGAADPVLSLYLALSLVELGLTQAAIEEARPLLAGATAEPYLLLAEALRSGGRAGDAALLLEEGRLRFPDRPELTVQLAGALLQSDRPLSAGLLLEQEAVRDPGLAAEGAECLRRAGRLQRALALNARVVDDAERYRQRLGLLLETQDWERAAALGTRLDRSGALRDDEVRYALAYARFRAGDGPGAEQLLGPISDSAAFARANALREAIARCAQEPAACD